MQTKIDLVALSKNREEAQRIMQICNACRYCEGFCGVFPAMTQYRSFNDQSLDYLANLCHNCRGCYYACQYAEPHEFNINVPKTFNDLRAESWQEHAWPRGLASAFKSNGLVLSLLTALSIAILLIGAAMFNDSEAFFKAYPDGNYKALIPHGVLVAIAAPIFLLAQLAVVVGAWRFWRHINASDQRDKTVIPNIKAFYQAIKHTLTLHNLSGSGHGCNDHSERFSMHRRYFHHSVFYGFMLCFAATATGTIYHYAFDWQAPHSYTSLPVVFGTVGGILLCIGTVGMYWMKQRTEAVLASPDLRGMEVGFIALLFFTSLTGLLLLALRETSLMGVILCIHLGFVLAFFLSIPYSKMVHGVYRLLALLYQATQAQK